VACDGRILIVREVCDELGADFEPFLVSVADIKRAVKANADLWRIKGEMATVSPGNDYMAKIGQQTVVKQDANFPDWTRVLIKKDKKGHRLSRFKPTYLMKVMRGMKDIDNVDMRVWDASSAARLDGITEDGRKVMALIMPVTPVKS
jgi:hypothetical protein